MDILGTLGSGLPVLVAQFAVALGLLALGVGIYTAITPFHEFRLMREGNAAAGLALSGTLISLAIPLAATLASSLVTLDILLWGAVALALQLLAFALVARLIPGLRAQIEAGNIAAAHALIGAQLAIALLNAGAMAG